MVIPVRYQVVGAGVPCRVPAPTAPALPVRLALNPGVGFDFVSPVRLGW